MAAKREPSTKVNRIFLVDRELLEAVRDAVAYTAGAPLFSTMQGFVEAAFQAELKRLQKRANGGKPFPKRPDRK